MRVCACTETSRAETASSATTQRPGNRFAFNYDYCKGCGVCVAECPCGAIEMVPEDV